MAQRYAKPADFKVYASLTELQRGFSFFFEITCLLHWKPWIFWQYTAEHSFILATKVKIKIIVLGNTSSKKMDTRVWSVPGQEDGCGVSLHSQLNSLCSQKRLYTQSQGLIKHVKGDGNREGKVHWRCHVMSWTYLTKNYPKWKDVHCLIIALSCRKHMAFSFVTDNSSPSYSRNCQHLSQAWPPKLN